MNRPNIEDFKPEYTKGVAEISSVAKQYVKAQEEYIDYLEEIVKNCSIPDVVGRSEQFYCSSWEDGEWKCETQCLGCAGLEEQEKQ